MIMTEFKFETMFPLKGDETEYTLVTDQYVSTGEFEEKKMLKAGDIVKCSPMTTHWHGASPEGPMIHLAMTPTREVNWLEAVTDEVYHSNGSVE